MLEDELGLAVRREFHGDFQPTFIGRRIVFLGAFERRRFVRRHQRDGRDLVIGNKEGDQVFFGAGCAQDIGRRARLISRPVTPRARTSRKTASGVKRFKRV